MHYLYGLADGNALQAKRLYEERFPDRNVPDARTFSNLHRRLCEKGSFDQDNHLKVQLIAKTPEIEDAVLNAIEEDPGLSIRKIANNLNITHVLVRRIFHDFLLYPYNIQWVQVLLPHDFPLRINFCQWFLQKVHESPLFNFFLFTDEAMFPEMSFETSTTVIFGRKKIHMLYQSLATRNSFPLMCGL
nr:unnamed protein product [Callosobruchus chinensis]